MGRRLLLGEDEPVVYGLTNSVGTYNLWTIAFHEWAALAADAGRARGVDCLRHALRGPGWQPAAPAPGLAVQADTRA